MQKAHGPDWEIGYSIIRNGVIVEHREDKKALPQESKIIIQDIRRPEHDVIELPFRSFVNNFLKVTSIYGFPTDPGPNRYQRAWDYTTVEASYGATTGTFNGTRIAGLQVGSSATAVTPDDYKLGSVIPHGTTAGTLFKGGMSRTGIVGGTNEQHITLYRDFLNQGTTNVDINEIGLSWCSQADDTWDSWCTLLSRDVVPTITIPATTNPYTGRRFSLQVTVSKEPALTCTKSYTQNFMRWFYDSLSSVKGYYFYGTDGVLIDHIYTWGGGWYNDLYSNWASYEGDSTLGLTVGTDATPPEFTDSFCKAPIVHGTGTGQLYYGSGARNSSGYPFTQLTVDGNDTYFTINRKYTNNSLAAITVTEYALSGAGPLETSPVNQYAPVCILRGLINGGTGVVLQPGDAMVLYLTLKLTS